MIDYKLVKTAKLGMIPNRSRYNGGKTSSKGKMTEVKHLCSIVEASLRSNLLDSALDCRIGVIHHTTRKSKTDLPYQ